MTTDQEHLRVVVHELGHALAGRSLGWRVRSLVTMPGRDLPEGGRLAGWCEHWPKDGLGPLEKAADEVTMYLAGEAAEVLAPSSGYGEVADGCAERAETAAREFLARRPADEETGFVFGVLSDSHRDPSDAEKAERLAREAAGAEYGAFMGWCGARAARLVAENLALFRLLVPVAMAAPILTGDDIEAAIAKGASHA